MNRIKLSIVALVLTSTGMFAQTISDAIKLTTNEQFEKADAMFTTLIQGQPNNGEYHFYAGENQFKNEQYEKAKQHYQKAVEVNPTNAFGYVGLGKLEWFSGKQTEAKANFF